MCDPVSIGIGIAIGAATGAAGAAITGQDVGKGALMGGIMGGLTGGFFPGSVGVTPLSPAFQTASTFGVSVGSSFISYAGVATAAGLGLAGSVAKGILMPEPEYTAEAWDYSPIAYNSQENQITGSGGNQAAAVLSDEIKRAKSKRAKQAQPKQDSYINTESFANSGLQLA